LKHAQTCLYCDQVAWLHLSHATKLFWEPNHVIFPYSEVVVFSIITEWQNFYVWFTCSGD